MIIPTISIWVRRLLVSSSIPLLIGIVEMFWINRYQLQTHNTVCEKLKAV